MRTILYTFLFLNFIDIIKAKNLINDYLSFGTLESQEYPTHCIYKVNLTKIPTNVTRDDFIVDTFALNFIKISVKNTDIDLPLEKRVFLDYSIERITFRENADPKGHKYAEWQITILVPNFDTNLSQKPTGVTAKTILSQKKRSTL